MTEHGIVSPPPTRPPPGPDLATSHPDDAIAKVRVTFNARCDRAHQRPVASKIPEQAHPPGQTPVRAIALSISSIPVAAPAPGHDPPPPDDGRLARARENAVSAQNAARCAVVSVNPPGADSKRAPRVGDGFVTEHGIVSPPPTRPPPGPDLATSHPDDAIANGKGYLQRQMRSSSPAASSHQNSRASTPTGPDPRSRDRAVDQQRPRSRTGARPRPPPPPDDGRLARARENAVSAQNAGKTPVRAIALSISSIPVAAPAPGHDPRRHLMTAASRAHEKTRRGW